MKILQFMCVVVFLTNSNHALARRDVQAHVHGEAELTLVVDGKNLQLEAKIPMNDLVGFEHKPKTQKQKELWKKASSKLKDAGSQIAISPDATCSLKEASLEDEDHHDKHAKHDKHSKHDDHQDKHDKHSKHDDHHDKHDKHSKHDDHHGKHHDEEHADVKAKYLFQCSKPASIKQIQINLFKHFPSLKKISASYVGPKGQGHKQLSPSDSVIQLSK